MHVFIGQCVVVVEVFQLTYLLPCSLMWVSFNSSDPRVKLGTESGNYSIVLQVLLILLLWLEFGHVTGIQ